MDLAETQQIDAVLVSELSRWGRSTQDLLATLHRLAGWKVSVVAGQVILANKFIIQGLLTAPAISF